ADMEDVYESMLRRHIQAHWRLIIIPSIAEYCIYLSEATDDRAHLQALETSWIEENKRFFRSDTNWGSTIELYRHTISSSMDISHLSG
ncbi:hypothetical protein L9F63_007954, partial [Diploptera punctata]